MFYWRLVKTRRGTPPRRDRHRARDVLPMERERTAPAAAPSVRSPATAHEPERRDASVGQYSRQLAAVGDLLRPVQVTHVARLRVARSGRCVMPRHPRSPVFAYVYIWRTRLYFVVADVRLCVSCCTSLSIP